MPSRGRGGSRKGKPRTAYPNRTDLPVKAAPSEQYGQRVAQEEAQRAVPMGRPGPEPMAGPPAGRPAGVPSPRELGSIFADTDRPDEPITSGSALGPGLGPEALLDPIEQERRQDAEQLRQYMPVLMFTAAQPGATASFRNYVRRTRASV